jgi:signal transduction histidine kinase
MSRTARLEAVNIRWVFRVYAVAVFALGFYVTAWGVEWIDVHMPGVPFGRAALLRVFGAMLMGAACFAAGLAAVDEPRAQKQGLFWFAVGHFVVWLVVLSQQYAIWGPGPAEWVVKGLFGATMILFYLWTTADGQPLPSPILTLFGKAPDAHAQLRSRYEEQIRAAARQEERNRLARDLHDSIKQQIFVIQTSAATAQARLGTGSDDTRQALDQVRDSAREASAEMQAMLERMTAAPLENAGLIEALRKQCEALGFRTGAKVEFRLGTMPESNALPPGAHEGIYRAAQEALANIGRHARANRVMMSLGEAEGTVRLTIEDDGAGFDPSSAPRGQGLANMRARADEFDGTFDLITQPGAGTTVIVSIPYARREPAAVYLRKAIEVGAALVACIVLQIWARKPTLYFVTGLAAIWTVRYAVAYRRAVGRTQ